MTDLIGGRDPKCWTLDTVVMGVVLAIPDYPYSRWPREDVQGIPIYGVTPSLRPNIHPCEIMAGRAPHQAAGAIVELPCWVTAGDYVLVATGEGTSVRGAKQQAYRILKRISLPNSPMYRTDIGDRLRTQLPDLQKLGYATDLNYLPTD
jgi:phosphoribosylamine--glycine ligase